MCTACLFNIEIEVILYIMCHNHGILRLDPKPITNVRFRLYSQGSAILHFHKSDVSAPLLAQILNSMTDSVSWLNSVFKSVPGSLI